MYARARVELKIWYKIWLLKKFKILKNFVKNACFLFFDMVLCLSTQPMKLIKKLVLGLGLQHILSEI